jgi:HSP20 family protein
MANVSRWDPFQDLLSIQDEMNQLFGRAMGQPSGRQGSEASTRMWAPALDISERKDAYLVTVEVPGVKAEDLEITLEDGLLTIQGERQLTADSSGQQQFHRVERRYGAFRRSITLPSRVQANEIEASFENGLLQVVVPKAEEAKPKKIEIRPGRQPVEGVSTSSSQ